MQSGAARGSSAEHSAVNIAVDTTCRPRTRVSLSWYRASHEPRGPSSSSFGPSTVTAPVCRAYRKRIVDLASRGPDPLCAAVSVRHRRLHLDILKDGKAKSVTNAEYYCWRLMQRDGRTWTSCCAATGCSSSTLSTPVRKWNSSR